MLPPCLSRTSTPTTSASSVKNSLYEAARWWWCQVVEDQQLGTRLVGHLGGLDRRRVVAENVARDLRDRRTTGGDRRFNDQWTNNSLEAIERRQNEQRAFLDRVIAIDASQLGTEDQLNYDLFRRQLQTAIDGQRFKEYLMPMSQRGGVQSLESTAERLRMQSAKDYEDWLERMAKVASVIEQTMKRMEQGRKIGYMPPKILMERIPAQLAQQTVENPEDSPFYGVFESMPDSMSDEDKTRLQASAKEIIDDSIVPAYRDFSRYFNNTYLPASRDSIGVSELPNGEAYYEHQARLFTTTQMTPDEIHRLGLNEVKRIRDEMQLIIDELEFDGDFADFLHFLRTDPQFYFEDPDDLYEAYLATCKRIDPELVKLFGKLPRMPYGLRPIPDNIAPDTTTAYYNRPAADGSRAGSAGNLRSRRRTRVHDDTDDTGRNSSLRA